MSGFKRRKLGVFACLSLSFVALCMTVPAKAAHASSNSYEIAAFYKSFEQNGGGTNPGVRVRLKSFELSIHQMEGLYWLGAMFVKRFNEDGIIIPRLGIGGFFSSQGSLGLGVGIGIPLFTLAGVGFSLGFDNYALVRPLRGGKFYVSTMYPLWVSFSF